MSNNKHIPRANQVEKYNLTTSQKRNVNKLIDSLTKNESRLSKRRIITLQHLVTYGVIRTNDPIIKHGSSSNVSSFLHWANEKLKQLGLVLTRYYVEDSFNVYFVRIEPLNTGNS